MEAGTTEQGSNFDRAVAEAPGPAAEPEQVPCSARMLDEARRPRNREMLFDPDGHAAMWPFRFSLVA